MVSYEEFKKAFGQKAKDMTDDQINKSIMLIDQISEAIFDLWLEKKNKPKFIIIELHCYCFLTNSCYNK
jgi:hypothetical protein